MATARSFDRYLDILGVTAMRPAPDHLTRLVGAQPVRVPFENISKLYLKKRFRATSVPSLDDFYVLLRHLGYDVTLCGADMSRPDVHVVSIVRL